MSDTDPMVQKSLTVGALRRALKDLEPSTPIWIAIGHAWTSPAIAEPQPQRGFVLECDLTGLEEAE